MSTLRWKERAAGPAFLPGPPCFRYVESFADQEQPDEADHDARGLPQGEPLVVEEEAHKNQDSG